MMTDMTWNEFCELYYPIAKKDAESYLRKQIGVVLQENYLFNGSIRENISLAKPEADMADVIQAAKLAGKSRPC